MCQCKRSQFSSNYNNRPKVRVLYYFYLNLFCRKSRSHFGGRRAIPKACGGRSTIGVVVAFRLVHFVDDETNSQNLFHVMFT